MRPRIRPLKELHFREDIAQFFRVNTLLAAALHPETAVWVTAPPPENARVTADSYLIMLADCAAHGGRWVITLDPALGITWPLPVEGAALSEKDRGLPTLAEALREADRGLDSRH